MHRLKYWEVLYFSVEKKKKRVLAFILPSRKSSFINPFHHYLEQTQTHNHIYKFTFESASRVSALLVTASFRTVHHPYASYTSLTFSVNHEMNAKIQNATSTILWLFFFFLANLIDNVSQECILVWGSKSYEITQTKKYWNEKDYQARSTCSIYTGISKLMVKTKIYANTIKNKLILL